MTRDSVTDVFPVTILLASSKRRSHRENIMLLGRSLLGFLEKNALAKHKLLREDGSVDDSRDITVADLTPEGAELMNRCLHRWLAYTDRTLKADNTSILEKELAKMRADRLP